MKIILSMVAFIASIAIAQQQDVVVWVAIAAVLMFVESSITKNMAFLSAAGGMFAGALMKAMGSDIQTINLIASGIYVGLVFLTWQELSRSKVKSAGIDKKR